MIPFLNHRNNFIVTIWSMEHKGNGKLYVVFACRVYKGAVRFSINTTAFKKSR